MEGTLAAGETHIACCCCCTLPFSLRHQNYIHSLHSLHTHTHRHTHSLSHSLCLFVRRVPSLAPVDTEQARLEQESRRRRRGRKMSDNGDTGDNTNNSETEVLSSTTAAAAATTSSPASLKRAHQEVSISSRQPASSSSLFSSTFSSFSFLSLMLLSRLNISSDSSLIIRIFMDISDSSPYCSVRVVVSIPSPPTASCCCCIRSRCVFV